MSDFISSVITGIVGVVLYEANKYLLKNLISNHKILILISMILAIIIGSLIIILLSTILS
jgi:H+/Cl- antiporter ClcA